MICFLLAAVLVSPRDEFFIISSVDPVRARIVVKRPTEVTAVLTVPPTATLRGERGETLRMGLLYEAAAVYWPG